MAIDNLGHLRKCSRIDTISLRQIPHGAGKVASLPWVDDSELKPFGLKRTGYGGFKSSGGFHQHKRNVVLSQLSDDGIKAVSVIGNRKLSLPM